MPVLKQGSSGPGVLDLQQKLKDLGFDPNGIDGNFGPGTEAAVVAFQQSKGLQADGIAGPATMAALQPAGGSASASTGGAPSGGGAGTPNTESTATAPNLNLAALAGIAPQAVIDPDPETAAKFGITTNLRLAHFL